MSRQEPVESELAALNQSPAYHRARFLRASCLAVAAGCVPVLVAAPLVHMYFWAVASALGLVVCAVAYVLSRSERATLAARVFVYGVITIMTFLALFDAPDTGKLPAYFAVGTLMMAIASFTLHRGDLLVTTGWVAAAIAVVFGRRVLSAGVDVTLTVGTATGAGFLVAQGVVVATFSSSARRDQERLAVHVDEIARVMAHAARIANGDLSGAPDEGQSEVAATTRAMQSGLRGLVTQTRDAASALASSAQEIAAMARQQEQGAVEQAAAVEQVRRTLALLVEGSAEAARSTEDVSRSVEATQRKGEVVAERAHALSLHTKRISAILEIIKTVANKAEILALNAALEGARAGEAGRGFSLVATQMQRLAESVMGSVGDVRVLVEDIDAATAATLAATEESTRLSGTATVAARNIGGALERQRKSAEQVASAIRDIQDIAAQVAAGSTRSLSATRDLTHLSAELTKAIERFRL